MGLLDWSDTRVDSRNRPVKIQIKFWCYFLRKLA
jgi:hypothetical protein